MESYLTTDFKINWNYPMTPEEELKRLKSAVAAVYYAAAWEADRPVDAQKLWANLRDAAGFAPGYSPTKLE